MGTVEKAAVLAMVDQLEAEEENCKQQVLARPQGSALLCAYSEDVTQWRGAIRRWLQHAGTQPVSFAQLCQGVALQRVEVWLGVLLGGFEVEGQGEFYGDGVWVSLPAGKEPVS